MAKAQAKFKDNIIAVRKRNGSYPKIICSNCGKTVTEKLEEHMSLDDKWTADQCFDCGLIIVTCNEVCRKAWYEQAPKEERKCIHH